MTSAGASKPNASRRGPATAAEALKTALQGFTGALFGIAVISGVVNLLALTGSFYMLQVYDRVLTSHSVPTLIAISVLAFVLYTFQGILDVLRSQILVRLGSRVDMRLTGPAHEAVVRLPLMGKTQADALQPIRDVDTIRGYLSSQGPTALFDMPWMPLYLIFVFMLHPLLGWMATAGAVLLVLLTFLTEYRTRALSQETVVAGAKRTTIADGNQRNAEVLQVMGGRKRALQRFAIANAEYLRTQSKLSDIAGGLSGISKVFRMILQSALLGLGAYLTLQGEVSAGSIIASSIATSRALAPIELAIANWKAFQAARQSFARLKGILSVIPAAADPLPLPSPKSTLVVENLSVTVPGTQRVVVNNVNLELKAGQGLAVIGPSAAGKSSLVRAITGIWPAARGSVRLDGATLDRWSNDDLGRHMGYLPQTVEMFEGTVTENISRFDENADPAAVIAAAKIADVHGLILRLPDGYETKLGGTGMVLSIGQRQRVALARALYRDPFLLVLDEPNSNLDSEGEVALVKAMQAVRERQGIVIVVAHRPSALSAVDLVAVMNNFQITSVGPKDEVLKKILRPAGVPAPVADGQPQMNGASLSHVMPAPVGGPGLAGPQAPTGRPQAPAAAGPGGGQGKALISSLAAVPGTSEAKS